MRTFVLCPNFRESDDDPCDYSNSSEVYGKVFMIELVVTFIYISYSLSGIYNRIGESITVNALGVGICLVCLITVSGGLTGACLNPYFGLVQTIYQRYLISYTT